jgi:hypothetical protein
MGLYWGLAWFLAGPLPLGFGALLTLLGVLKMKLVNKVKAGLFSAAVAATSFASAAGVDISADTAQAKTDIATAGGLIVGVVVAVAAISWIRRVIK